MDGVWESNGSGGVVKYTAVGIVVEAQLPRAPDPVVLRLLLSPLPAGLEGLVRFLRFAGDANAVLEVEPLHVGDGLVQPADGAGVANRPLGAVTVGQMRAEDAPDSHLTLVELLRSLAVAAADVGRRGGEGLDVALPDVAVPLRQRILVLVAVEPKDDALPVSLVRLGVCSGSIRRRASVRAMSIVPTRAIVLGLVLVLRLLLVARCLALPAILR